MTEINKYKTEKFKLKVKYYYRLGFSRSGLEDVVWLAECLLRSPLRDTLCRREGKEAV